MLFGRYRKDARRYPLAWENSKLSSISIKNYLFSYKFFNPFKRIKNQAEMPVLIQLYHS